MPLLKIDRVATQPEVEALHLAGADLITFSVCENLDFLDIRGDLELDERDLSLAEALILSYESPLLCGVELYPDTDLEAHWEQILNFDFVQFSLHMVHDQNFPSEAFLLKLHQQKMPVLYAQLELGSCMPVDYSLTFLRELDCQLASAFQLEIMTDYEDAWEDLISVHPEYPDDCIQLEQLQRFCSNLPQFLSLNVNAENIEAIATAFPQALGLSLIIGQDPYGSQHMSDLEDVLTALKKINKKQEPGLGSKLERFSR